MNHTPGPWAKHTPSSPTQTAVIVRELPEHRRTVVAVIPDHREFGSASVADFYEAEANARLIAAAPEVLAALKELIKHVPVPSVPMGSDFENPFPLPEHIKQARAAIAKAEGKV